MTFKKAFQQAAAGVSLLALGACATASGPARQDTMMPVVSFENLKAQIIADKNFFRQTGALPPDLNYPACDLVDQQSTSSSLAGPILGGALGGAGVNALSHGSDVATAAGAVGGIVAGSWLQEMFSNPSKQKAAEDCTRIQALNASLGGTIYPTDTQIDPGARLRRQDQDPYEYRLQYGGRFGCVRSGGTQFEVVSRSRANGTVNAVGPSGRVATFGPDTRVLACR